MSGEVGGLRHAAHLWLARIDPTELESRRPALLDLLSPAERERWEGIRVARGRDEYLAGRALLRTTLSRYDDRDPRAWRFRIGERGRPELEDDEAAPGLSFNLAHAEGLVACVVARGGAAGVDVERPERRVDVDALAARFFAPGERDHCRRLEGTARREVFFAYWTLKEAYLKAVGIGIGVPLRTVAFQWEGERVRAGFPPELDDRPERWQFDLLWAGTGHWVATALRADGGEEREVIGWWVDLGGEAVAGSLALEASSRR